MVFFTLSESWGFFVFINMQNWKKFLLEVKQEDLERILALYRFLRLSLIQHKIKNSDLAKGRNVPMSLYPIREKIILKIDKLRKELSEYGFFDNETSMLEFNEYIEDLLKDIDRKTPLG